MNKKEKETLKRKMEKVRRLIGEVDKVLGDLQIYVMLKETKRRGKG